MSLSGHELFKKPAQELNSGLQSTKNIFCNQTPSSNFDTANESTANTWAESTYFSSRKYAPIQDIAALMCQPNKGTKKRRAQLWAQVVSNPKSKQRLDKARKELGTCLELAELRFQVAELEKWVRSKPIVSETFYQTNLLEELPTAEVRRFGQKIWSGFKNYMKSRHQCEQSSSIQITFDLGDLSYGFVGKRLYNPSNDSLQPKSSTPKPICKRIKKQQAKEFELSEQLSQRAFLEDIEKHSASNERQTNQVEEEKHIEWRLTQSCETTLEDQIDVRQNKLLQKIIGQNSSNSFFQKTELNTLIVDAQISFRNLYVHQYAVQRVDEAEKLKQKQEEQLAKKQTHLENLRVQKRKFGEKKSSKKKLMSQVHQLTEARIAIKEQNQAYGDLPRAEEDELLEDFKDRSLKALMHTPLDLVLPDCLTEENDRLSRRYKMLQHPFYGPCLQKQTDSRIIFFELLHEQIFKAAKKNIKTQAQRSIGRLLSYLIDLHYPNFFIDGKRIIDGRMTIMNEIKLKINLKEAPQRLFKRCYSTDLSQASNVLNQVECLLQKLRFIARRVDAKGHLLAKDITKEEEQCLEYIKQDTKNKSMIGIKMGLQRFASFISDKDQNHDYESERPDLTEGLTMKELQMRARAIRVVGVPPCIDIHHDLKCKCCEFD